MKRPREIGAFSIPHVICRCSGIVPRECLRGNFPSFFPWRWQLPAVHFDRIDDLSVENLPVGVVRHPRRCVAHLPGLRGRRYAISESVTVARRLETIEGRTFGQRKCFPYARPFIRERILVVAVPIATAEHELRAVTLCHALLLHAAQQIRKHCAKRQNAVAFARSWSFLRS